MSERTSVPGLLERVDALALELDVARAAVVRALVRFAIGTPAPQLRPMIKADTIRRGREQGKPQRRRARA